MLSLEVLSELGRQRRRDIARDVALCHYVRSPLNTLGRMLVAVGALAVFSGSFLAREPERKPDITPA